MTFSIKDNRVRKVENWFNEEGTIKKQTIDYKTINFEYKEILHKPEVYVFNQSGLLKPAYRNFEIIDNRNSSN